MFKLIERNDIHKISTTMWSYYVNAKMTLSAKFDNKAFQERMENFYKIDLKYDY